MSVREPRRPRIAPVREPVGETAQILAALRIGNEAESAPLNVFTTLANHPRLLKRFNVLAGLFMSKGELSARQRELVILRVAVGVESEYEWGQHVLIARRCGVQDAEIEAIRAESVGEMGFAAGDAALLDATDELLANCDLSDATWQGVRDVLTEAQTLELIMLVGLYRMLAGMLISVGVERDAGVPGW